MLLCGILILSHCASLKTLFNSFSGKQKFSRAENSQFYSPDTTKLFEGMTMSMVKNKLGEPESIKPGNEGLVIWKYSSSELYFVDDVLINWKEWPNLNFQSTQF